MLNIKVLKGFTLVEILVSIAIVTFLIGISVPMIRNAQRKSRDVQRMAELEKISKAMNKYYTTYNIEPQICWGWVANEAADTIAACDDPYDTWCIGPEMRSGGGMCADVIYIAEGDTAAGKDRRIKIMPSNGYVYRYSKNGNASDCATFKSEGKRIRIVKDTNELYYCNETGGADPLKFK